MRTTYPPDIRCRQCYALLAKRDRDALLIRRGPMQTTVTGTDFTIEVICYRCSTRNVAAFRSRRSRIVRAAM